MGEPALVAIVAAVIISSFAACLPIEYPRVYPRVYLREYTPGSSFVAAALLDVIELLLTYART